MPVITFSWTQEGIDLLKSLWGTGLSASKIAAELGYPATKNAVIGKARRVGLPPRPSPLGGAAARAHFSDPQQLEALKRLKEMGHSCLSISRALNIPKDAVANKLTQLGLHTIKQTPNKSWRNSTLRSLPSEEGNVQQASMLETLLFRAPVVQLPVFSRQATCQWVVSERPYRFCDKPAMLFQANGQKCPEGAVWCVECRKKVYVSRAQEQQDKAA